MRFERFSFSPQLIQARWVLEKLPAEEVPGLAQNALEVGYDGRNIRRIAGFTQPNSGDLQPLMDGFFGELGLHAQPSPEEAGWLLARFVAQAITEERVTPYEGASFIWRDVANNLWPNQQHPLLSFVGQASEYEDCESYSHNPEKTRRQIEQQIIADARALLASQG